MTKSILVDDKQYWKKRHISKSDLKASGVQSVGVRSNNYIYQILKEQYLSLLQSLDLTEKFSIIDCGFGDGYFLRFFKEFFPEANIYGVDISKDAKRKIDFISQDKLIVSDLTELKLNKKFDVVHSFDVLYHILSNSDFELALQTLTRMSKDYVILHERFLDKVPKISSRHVRLRQSQYTMQLLNANGFYQVDEKPTHFIAMRMLTYKLNNFFPRLLYRVDKYIADNAHPSTQESLASHKIRVFKKYR